MVRVAAGSHTTISASEPTAITPWIYFVRLAHSPGHERQHLLGVDVEDPGSCGASDSHISAWIHQASMLQEKYEREQPLQFALTTPFSQITDMRSSTPAKESPPKTTNAVSNTHHLLHLGSF